jgi:hypothetical protein
MLKGQNDRSSVSYVYKGKNQWLISINDIIEEQELCRMALNEHNLDKINMNPLSQYIVINKLRIEKDQQISKLRPFDWDETKYKEIYDVILSDKMQLYSNCGKRAEKSFMDIIKRAFLLYVSKESICMYIERKLSKICETQWKCTCNVDLTHPNNISVISWRNTLYICAYHVTINGLNVYIVATHTQNHVIACNDRLSIPSQIPLSHLVNQIVNSFNDHITQVLIEMVFGLFRRYAFLFINHEFSKSYVLVHSHNDLSDIRNLIGDDTAKCYMSQNDKIVLYRNYDHSDIICKYAAIIPETGFGFAIFTMDKVSHTDASQHHRRILENMVMEEKEFENFMLIQSNPIDDIESLVSNIKISDIS